MDYYDIGEAAVKKYGNRLGPWAQDRYMPLLRTSSGLILKKYRLFNAENNFKVIYPDAKHYFSPEAREEAYRFMDRALKNSENNVNVR